MRREESTKECGEESMGEDRGLERFAIWMLPKGGKNETSSKLLQGQYRSLGSVGSLMTRTC